MSSWWGRLRTASVAVRCGVLIGVTLAVLAAVAPVAMCLSGLAGLGTAAAAAGVCLLGAVLALAAGHRLRVAKQALAEVLVGMFLRMAVPLSALLICQLCEGVLAEHGFVYYLVVFYPVTLSIEVALSLPGGGGLSPSGG